MPVMMLNENHCSAELLAKLDFLLSDVSVCSVLPHHPVSFFCIRGKLVKMLEDV